MISQSHIIKRRIAKRLLFILTAITLVLVLSAMTFYTAGADNRLIPSEHCDGGDCCTSSDCTCTNCTAHPGYASYPEVIIEDEPIPLFSADGRDFFLFAPMGIPTWAIFNLIATAAGILFSLLTIFKAIKQKKHENNEVDEYTAKLVADNNAENEELLAFIENEDRYNRQRRLIALIAMYVLSFSAALLLILTQNFKGAVALLDFWSVAHTVILACLLVSGSLVFKKYRRELLEICTV